MATHYISQGIIHPNIQIKTDQIRHLYKVLTKLEISSVDIYYNEESFIIGYESLSNGIIGYLVAETSKFEAAEATIITPSDNSDFLNTFEEDEEDFAQLQNELPNQGVVGDYGVTIDATTSNSTDLTYIRFRAPKQLVMVLQKIADDMTISIDTKEIIVQSGKIKNISMSVMQTNQPLEHYIKDDDITDWDAVNPSAISGVAKLDTLFEASQGYRSVTLIGKTISAFNKSVVIQANSWEVKRNYLLAGITLSLFESIPKQASVHLGRDDKAPDFTSLRINNTHFTFKTNQVTASKSLISKISGNDLVMVCHPSKKSWSDFNLLRELSGIDKSNTSITISTMDNGVIIKHDRTIISLDGNFNPGFEFSVDINQLLKCKANCGSAEPKLYISIQDNDNYLLIKGELTLAIRITSKKLSSEFKKQLEQIKQVDKSQYINTQEYDENIQAESTKLKEEEKVAEELNNLDSAFESYIASNYKDIKSVSWNTVDVSEGL